MFRLPSKSRIAIALLCAVLVASRIAGAHLHLCFDGSEPPVSLHMGDSGEHHDHEAGGIPHTDQDVKVGGDYLSSKPGSKKFGGNDLGTVALLLVLLLFFFPRLLTPLPDYLVSTPRPSRRHGLPPPRGPPRRP